MYRNIGTCGLAPSGRVGENEMEQLFFLKTTKTGGSSLRELFIRFALFEDKRILRSNLPGGILFSPNGSWVHQHQLWPPKQSGTYDIAFDHSTLDPEKLARYMPNATWVTVSRDPLQRIISAIAFFHNEATPQQLLRTTCRDSNHHRVWNSVAWQLFVDEARSRLNLCEKLEVLRSKFDAANMSHVISFVESGQLFVMLTDHMDESRVLLRSRLCWRWLDVLMPGPPISANEQDHNVRMAHKFSHSRAGSVRTSRKGTSRTPAKTVAPRRASKHAAAEQLPPNVAKKLLTLNGLDVRFHDAAKKKFDEYAVRYGAARLTADVTFLRRFQAAVSVMCLACNSGTDHKALVQKLPAFRPMNCSEVACICDVLMYKIRLERPANRNANPTPRRKCSTQSLSDFNAAQDSLEHTVVSMISNCSSMHNVTICKRSRGGDPSLCAKSEICLGNVTSVQGPKKTIFQNPNFSIFLR